MTKTYLSPSRQARNTLALADEWARGAMPVIKAVKELWDRHSSLGYRPSRFIEDGYDEIHQRLLAGSRRKQVRSYLDFLSSCANESWAFGDTWVPGLVRWSDKRLVKGDLVLVLFENGTERHPVWCVTTKGRRVSGYYCDTNRSGATGTIIELHEVPGELVGLQLADPDPQMYCNTLRTGNSPHPGRCE